MALDSGQDEGGYGSVGSGYASPAGVNEGGGSGEGSYLDNLVRGNRSADYKRQAALQESVMKAMLLILGSNRRLEMIMLEMQIILM